MNDFVYSDVKPKYDISTLSGYDTVYDLDAIRNSLINIFTVQKGEVPGKPWFGNPLRIELFDNFDIFTEQTIKSAIENELEKFDPRILIDNISVNLMPEKNRIIVTLNYHVNLESNHVEDTLYLPFSHNDLSFLGSREVIAT